jgi:rhamnogalacturonyl hydrolase YesR
MKKEIYGVILLCCLLSACSLSRKGSSNPDNGWIDQSLHHAAEQYKILMTKVPGGSMPHSYQNNKIRAVKPTGWTAGFYTGTLVNLYKISGDKALYDEALKKIVLMDSVQYYTGNHDLGFMMYCSYGTLYSMSPKEEYRKILINSAESLTKRYSPVVKSIRSWGKIEDDNEFIVIIDNMMNLELLMWASKITGNSKYRDIAVAHANTTLTNHFRADNSSYHVVAYNPKTGGIMQKRTAQGARDESAWARGQAWGLYGFTMMYRETRDKRYLEQANKIAAFILSNRNLPNDKIPYWDFNAADIPSTPRDASSAAIIASALLELSGYTNGSLTKQYRDQAYEMLRSLASPKYSAPVGSNGGFILMHSVSNFPRGIEVDVPLIYADYYFIEGLMRLKEKMRR